MINDDNDNNSSNEWLLIMIMNDNEVLMIN